VSLYYDTTAIVHCYVELLYALRVSRAEFRSINIEVIAVLDDNIYIQLYFTVV